MFSRCTRFPFYLVDAIRFYKPRQCMLIVTLPDDGGRLTGVVEIVFSLGRARFRRQRFENTRSLSAWHYFARPIGTTLAVSLGLVSM